MDNLEGIFGSKTRAEIFRLLFESSDSEFYLRELQRRTGMSLRPVQQELANLSEIGLVKSRQDGNRLYYRANTEHPLFPEIRSLVEKTSGVRAMLERMLQDSQVHFAFIFGSVAAGNASPGSDLDLFVVGELGLRKLTKLLSGATERIGRVVNPHVMTAEEFVRRAQKKDHFISNILRADKIFVVGNENEFKRLAKK